MSDLGLMSYVLGLEVKQDGICICQKKYVQDSLNSYQLQHCKSVLTPLKSDYKLCANPDEGLVNVTEYR